MEYYKPGPYEPISGYEAPQILVTQLFDGTLSGKSVASTMFDGGVQLSPRQRESFSKRLADKYELGPVGSGALNILSNPFVWAAVLFTPAGRTAAKLTATGVKNGSKNVEVSQMFGDVIEKSPIPHLLQTVQQLVDGTPAGRVFHAVVRHKNRLSLEWNQTKWNGKTISQWEEQVAKDLGVKLRQFQDPSKIRDEKLRARVQAVHDAIHGSLGGRDLGAERSAIRTARIVPRYRMEGPMRWDTGEEVLSEGLRVQIDEAVRNVGRSGDVEPLWVMNETGDRAFLVSRKGTRGDLIQVDEVAAVQWAQEGELTKFLKGVGEESAWGLRETISTAMGERLVRMIGKEGSTLADFKKAWQAEGSVEELVDSDKVIGMWHSQTHRNLQRGDYSDDSLVNMLLNGSQRDALKNGDMSLNQFQGEIRRGMAMSVNMDAYMPRHHVNMYYADETGKVVSGSVDDLEGLGLLNTRTRDPARASGRLAPIRAPIHVWDAEDVNRMASGFEAQGIAVSQDGVDTMLDAWDNASLSVNVPTDRHIERVRASVRGKGRARRKAQMKAVSLLMAKAQAAGGRHFVAKRIDLYKGIKDYERQTALDYGLHVAPLDSTTLAQANRTQQMLTSKGLQPRSLDKEDLLQWQDLDGVTPSERAWEYSWGATARKWDGERNLGPNRTTNADLLRLGAMTLRVGRPGAAGKKAVDMFSNTAVPAALGLMHQNRFIGEWGIKSSQQAANVLLNIRDSKQLGPLFKKMISDDQAHKMRWFTDQDPRGGLSKQLESSTAGWLYASHLGIPNFASTLVNATQPFMHLASIYGVGPVIKSYGDAIADMQAYMAARWKFSKSPTITPEQRRTILEGLKGRGRFVFFEESGILGNLLEDLDRLAFSEGFQNTRFGKAAVELPLKLFEKAEWMNRLVTAHTVDSFATREILDQLKSKGLRGKQLEVAFERARNLNPDQNMAISREIQRVVEETQFGATVLNTPMLFLQGEMGKGFGSVLGQLAGSPLIRQFTSFTMRTPLSFLHMGKQIAGGTRQIGIPGTGLGFSYQGGAFHDITRAVGISAVGYELAKMAGWDLSRAGVLPAFHDAAPVGNLMSDQRGREAPRYLIPPSISIVTDTIGGLLRQDAQMLGGAAARMVPGGLGMQRVLRNFGKDPGPGVLGDIAGSMQKTYADWDNMTPDGRVPVFKWDGSLLGYESPSKMIFQSMGFNTTQHKKANEFDYYMTSIRDQITETRRALLSSIMSNDISKATRIRGEFEKKFGFPLTVSRAQMKSFIKLRTNSRTERILDRMPTDMREQYQAMGVEQAPYMNRDPDILQYQSTASKRNAHAPQHGVGQMNAAQLEEIKKSLKDPKGMSSVEQAVESGSYAPFKGY